MRAIGIVVVGAILLNVALVVLGRGSFLHGLVVIGLVIYVALPAGIFGLFAWAMASRWPGGRVVARRVCGVVCVLGSSVVSLLIGAAIVERDIEDAKRYCESLLPRLEEHQRRLGKYPPDIRALGEVATPPQLLREGSYYSSDGVEFRFSFAHPAGMMNGYGYDSSAGYWYEWD